jgi:subtilisin family serine protease
MSRSLIFDTYRDQWAWKKIGLEKAWARVAAAMQQQSADNEQITVAIVDCGIKADHEAFVENRQLVSCDRVITPRDGTCGDDDGHGTMLAGTIAGVINPRCGDRVRVPPVRLLSVKFIDWYTPPMSRNAAEAIRHAVDQGARIINASWEVGLKSRELEEAMQDASNKGVLVIVAAGNNGGNEDDYRTYPAGLDLPNLISVMASDREDEKPYFSNYGRDTVDIAAPGVDIISTFPYLYRPAEPPRSYDPAYRSYSGTSPAAAHVSGAAALLLALNPDWTPQKVRKCLLESAKRVTGLRPFCPEGRRLNLDRAVKMALQS